MFSALPAFANSNALNKPIAIETFFMETLLFCLSPSRADSARNNCHVKKKNDAAATVVRFGCWAQDRECRRQKIASLLCSKTGTVESANDAGGRKSSDETLGLPKRGAGWNPGRR
jgi:hypothetical protein